MNGMVNPDTFEFLLTDKEDKERIINDKKYYKLDIRIMAVMIYRVNRANEAVQRQEMSGEEIMPMVRRFYIVANWFRKNLGESFLVEAEKRAAEQMAERKAKEAA